MMVDGSSLPSWREKCLALLPLGILLFALATIVAAYDATFRSGVLEFQQGTVKTPPISLLMFAGPGRTIGQIGFPLISILFGCIAPKFYNGIQMAVEQRTTSNNYRWTVRLLVGTAAIAFAGLATVGIIPLQENLEQVMTQRAPIRWDSIVHQSAAAVFFLFSISHMAIWLHFSARSSALDNLPFYYRNSPLSFLIKLVCFMLCFIPLPTAFLLHPISPVRERLGLSHHDAGGITQYALVACVSGFFASYSYELWQMIVPTCKEIQKNNDNKAD